MRSTLRGPSVRPPGGLALSEITSPAGRELLIQSFPYWHVWFDTPAEKRNERRNQELVIATLSKVVGHLLPSHAIAGP